MKMTTSSGNVFKDLGFEREEAENLRVRAVLMAEIEKYIRRKGMTQAEAAKRLGVTQPRISDLMRGKIDVFSVDTLIAMLAQIGLMVRLRIEKAKAA
ncbi:MAG: XRE family transcriptional regulator [Nitrospirae bacterium]|nr:XRE family transcriptional regulator [Nitrospirota bacterium]MBI3392073.1 XRE family transcriptional regulator [Nitrospirota bacterium]